MKITLRALAEQLRGQVSAGAEWRGELRDGDLVAEVTVRVRRHVPLDAAHGYRERAMEALRKQPLRVRHCNCSVQRRSGWGTHRADCSGRVVAAVVYTSYDGLEAYRFVCSRHRDDRLALAVVELFESFLRPIHAQAKRNAAAWDARCRAEDEERDGAPTSHVVAYYELAAREPCVR